MRDIDPPEEPCEVCGFDLDHCKCPECPVCGDIGNLECYSKHGLEFPAVLAAAKDPE